MFRAYTHSREELERLRGEGAEELGMALDQNYEDIGIKVTQILDEEEVSAGPYEVWEPFSAGKIISSDRDKYPDVDVLIDYAVGDRSIGPIPTFKEVREALRGRLA